MFRQQAQGRSDYFVSAKTDRAIPAPDASVREALIQSSLDPKVLSISYVSSASMASQPVDRGVIVITRHDGRFLLGVVVGRRIRDIDDEPLDLVAAQLGLGTLTVTTDEIAAEPRYANSRLVWSYNGLAVPIGLRMGILQALLDDGPMPLGRLLASVNADRDPTPAVLAMACADLVELDLLSRPLGPLTMVGSRA